MSSVLAFMENNGSDHKKRKLLDIIKEDDHFWEREHDFIQWLFPLDEKSMAVPNSPVIREPEITFIKESAVAQISLDTSIARYKEFLNRNNGWHSANDHNHLRITRVLKCLKLIRNLESAQQFKYWVASELGDSIDVINAKTQQYWRLM